MRASRDDSSVVLIKYNQKRSMREKDIFLAVEGGEDISFYDTVINRIPLQEVLPYYFFVCDGKDRVLELYDVLKNNIESSSAMVAFIVDHDFDGLKGRDPHEMLYVTKAYSIENYLVSRTVVEKILNAELKCHNSDDDISAGLACFDRFCENYQNSFYLINKSIYISRTSNSFKVNTQKSIENNVKLDLRHLDFNINDAQSCRDFLTAEIATGDLKSLLDSKNDDFDRLDPIFSWRGKYVFHSFIRFLKLLVEDRGRRKDREVFSTRAGVNFSPDEGSIRLLASVIDIPKCMKEFFETILGPPFSPRVI